MALTLAQLKAVFFDVSVEMSGLPEAKIRHAYQQDGQPAMEIAQDVLYIFIKEIEDIWNKQRNTTITNGQIGSGFLLTDPDGAILTTELGEPLLLDPMIAETCDIETSYTRVIQVDWVMYGPNSFDIIEQIRWKILTESIRSLLAAEDIKPISQTNSPVHLPESFNQQWWERSDFSARFYVGTEHLESVPTLIAADIHVVPESGDERIISVTQ